jgi:Polyketide cyclase / dehydrase and lipid transport
VKSDNVYGPFIRVESEIEIHREPRRVFDYATAPALWHTWHPATVEVKEVPQRPLATGEKALEIISVLGRRDEALWTVTQCSAPELWAISTETPNGIARIEYRIKPTPSGSAFHRTLEFRSRRAPWRLLDSTFTRWVLRRQSARALRNLKRVLEQTGG